MQRVIASIILLCVMQANAAYISASIGDSRIQEENYAYKPGGIVHVALEAGLFNEPENLIDYKLALGIDRFGYSHSDGDKSVSLWEVYFKPMIWSVTYRKVMFEFAPFAGFLIASDGLTDYNEHRIFDATNEGFFLVHNKLILGYEYRLGYQINDMFYVGVTANYHYSTCGFYHDDARKEKFYMGGWGLNFQYNLPW